MATALLLTGCASAPSPSDINTDVARFMQCQDRTTVHPRHLIRRLRAAGYLGPWFDGGDGVNCYPIRRAWRLPALGGSGSVISPVQICAFDGIVDNTAIEPGVPSGPPVPDLVELSLSESEDEVRVWAAANTSDVFIEAREQNDPAWPDRRGRSAVTCFGETTDRYEDQRQP